MTYACPVPVEEKEVITLSHGSGGRQTHQLIQTVFLPAFQNRWLEMLHDGAFLTVPDRDIVMTTDSYVVQPIFFPGGDIGKLAITGTVNDLAMCGAKPLYFSCSLILEEGFPIEDIRKVVDSMQREAKASGVHIVTADTKVIERTSGKNLFINTTGIGVKWSASPINPLQIREGDAILLSGDIGRHGMAVMAEREGLRFETPLLSDCALLAPAVEALLQGGIELHCLRDITRGGLATCLVELAESAQSNFLIEEETIPICNLVEGACEILGLDPLYVACEGRFVTFVPAGQVAQALAILARHDPLLPACQIGTVESAGSLGSVTLQNGFGTERYLHRMMGSLLPRIC